MPNWLNGYIRLTGSKEDLMQFIQYGIYSSRDPIYPSLEGDYIVFPEDFFPEELYVIGSTRAFIGFEYRNELKETNTENVYSLFAFWTQAWSFKPMELSTLCKRYNFFIEAEGIEPLLGNIEHIIINNFGEILLASCEDYDTDNYDPYDEYRRIK